MKFKVRRALDNVYYVKFEGELVVVSKIWFRSTRKRRTRSGGFQGQFSCYPFMGCSISVIRASLFGN